MVVFCPFPKKKSRFFGIPIFLGKDWAPRKGWLESQVKDSWKLFSPSRSSLLRTEEHGNKLKRFFGTWVANALGNEVIVAMFIGWKSKYLDDNQKNPFILEVIWYLADTPTWSAVQNYTHPVLLTNSNTPLPFLMSCVPFPLYQPLWINWGQSHPSRLFFMFNQILENGATKDAAFTVDQLILKLKVMGSSFWCSKDFAFLHLHPVEKRMVIRTKSIQTFGPPNKIRSERPVQFIVSTSFNLPNTAYALANPYSWLENGALKGYPITFSINLRIILSNQLSWWRYNSSKHRLRSEPAGKSSRIPVRIILLLLVITILLQVHSICAHLPQTNHILVVQQHLTTSL